MVTRERRRHVGPWRSGHRRRRARSAEAALVACLVAVAWTLGPGGAAQRADDQAAPTVVGEVRYHAADQRSAWTGVAPLHVERLDADLAALDEARLEALVRVADLRSGNALRDYQARAGVFDAANHPEVRFRLTEVVGGLDPSLDVPQPLELLGVLTVRGVERTVRVAASVVVGAAHVEVTARFEVSLETFGIAAPRFLTLVVDDAVAIEVDASWPRDPGSTATTR